MTELDQSVIVRSRDEIDAKAYDLINSKTGMSDDQIDLALVSERAAVQRRATKLGFQTFDGRARTDEYQLPGKSRSVSVRYDDYGAVVSIDASTQVAEFQATREGAFDALFYTAQYSDIRRRILRDGDLPERP